MKKLVLSILLSSVLAACSSGDDVIATINGEDISKTQFDAYLDFKRIKVRDDKHRSALIDQFLDREALSQVISQQEKHDQVKAQAELDEFRRQMNISRYFQEYLKAAVTDQQVQNFYVSNEKNYAQKKVHVAHILFRLKKGMSDEERNVKLTQAHEAYSKLNIGDSFEEIAATYSEDKISANKAGDLGWLKKGAIDKRFSDKVFSMKKDDLSEPFETSFGFHIVKIIEEPKTVKKPFEAVKGDIRYQLRQSAKQAELDALKAKIKISRNN